MKNRRCNYNYQRKKMRLKRCEKQFRFKKKNWSRKTKSSTNWWIKSKNLIWPKICASNANRKPNPCLHTNRSTVTKGERRLTIRECSPTMKTMTVRLSSKTYRWIFPAKRVKLLQCAPTGRREVLIRTSMEWGQREDRKAICQEHPNLWTEMKESMANTTKEAQTERTCRHSKICLSWQKIQDQINWHCNRQAKDRPAICLQAWNSEQTKWSRSKLTNSFKSSKWSNRPSRDSNNSICRKQ